MQKWTVYILECADKTLYTGITTDLNRRVAEHNNGKGAKYTRARLPVKQVFQTDAANRSEASKLEYKIKQFTKKQKLDIISNNENI